MTKSQNEKSISIVGAGPVGALLAAMLGKKGYQVDVFEARADSRKSSLYQGKSINLALSDRGWKALQAVGVDAAIREQAIPMYCRVMHDKQGKLSRLAYGKDQQAIWSVSRAGINEQLISLADKSPNVTMHFQQRLRAMDFTTGIAQFSETQNGDTEQLIEHKSDLMFGADGAFSKVRRLAQDLTGERISHSLDYMPQSYIELRIPAKPDGSHAMEKNALHIWPRKAFMLIALPNPDGSFTCTLFMNQQGDLSFDSLDDRHKVNAFFQEYFSDALPMLDNPIDSFLSKAASPLCLVHIYPWVVNNRTALIGDAAHAMVPFYGQGMNCGFEDCRVLSELVEQHQHNWDNILDAYQEARKDNCDAIIELAQRNFVEMSDLSGDIDFLLRKKIEASFSEKHPELWEPLYSMVTFRPDIPYLHALRTGDIQRTIMDEIMALPDIHTRWQDDDVYQQLLQLAQNTLKQEQQESPL